MYKPFLTNFNNTYNMLEETAASQQKIDQSQKYTYP